MEDEEKKRKFKDYEIPNNQRRGTNKCSKNIKNGKATGVNGVMAKLMKFIIMNNDIKKYMLKCFNNVLKEDIHEDWLLSKTTMIPKVKKIINSGPQTNSCDSE